MALAACIRRLHKSGRIALAGLLLTACGGGASAGVGDDGGGGSTDSGDSPAPAVVLTDMQPLEHGFAFANFPASWYEDEFVTEDLVAMFGSGPSVCVDGVAESCELTAEAAAFARMVNQSRASGHCEGLVAVAQARFNERSDPTTAMLLDDTETIKAIMRAFATQFIPEVRAEVTEWMGTSLAEKVAALEASLAEGRLEYSLGVYIEGGGHAILPYAIEYLTPTTPRIMIYDSNWPGRNRWVDVDLETETWTFSFSGDDPLADPDLWSGGADRMDLTGIDTRAGSCPFCDGDVTTTKNVLLVRSTDLDWSVEAGGATVDPANPGEDGDEVVVTPVKGQSGPGRTSYDYLIELPAGTDGERAKLNLPGTTSVFALTPSGIAQISTPGNADIPIEVGDDSFVANDPAVSLSLASGNLVATASGPSASLTITDEGLTAAVTTADGQTVEVAVTPETPAARIVADPTGGGIEVLAQAADGIVEKRKIAADGTVTVSIETTPLNLNATSWEAPPGLESAPLPMLPPPDARNVNNPDYAVDEPYTPPANAVSTADTVPPTTRPPATTAPPVTTAAPPSTTTAPPTTVAPTTTAPAAFTASRATPTATTTTSTTTTTTTTTTTPPTTPPTTTTTTAPTTTTTTTVVPVAPSLVVPTSLSAIVGDGTLILAVLTDSPAPVSFVSSDDTVARIGSVSGIAARIAIVGAGTATITVSQTATGNFAAISRDLVLEVSKREQTALSVENGAGFVGSTVTLTTAGGSGTGAITYELTGTGNAGCTLDAGRLSRSTAGTCTVTATKAGDAEHLPVTSAAATVTFAALVEPTLDLPATMTATIGDEPIALDVVSDSPAPMTFTSSDTNVATVEVVDDDRATITIVAAGTATITVSQEAVTGYTAVSATSILTVNRRTQAPLTITSASSFAGTPVTLSTTGGSGTGAVNYAISSGTGCTITGDQLARSTAGSCTVVATRAGDDEHLPVTSATATITFAAVVTPTLDLPSTMGATIGDAARTLTVTSTSPAAMTFTSSNTGVARVTRLDDTSVEITFVASGSTTITITQAAVPGYAAVTRTSTLTVNRLTQAALSITTTSGVAEVALALSATGGTTTGAITYALSGTGNTGCTLINGQITRSSAGTCTVVATRAGDATYQPVQSPATAITFVVVNFPTAVTDLTTIVSGGSVDLAWTPATSADVALDGHRVRYRRVGSTTDWITHSTVSASTTSATISGLVGSYDYDIEVAGTNSRGVGTAATATVTIAGTTPTVSEIVPTACALVVGSSPGGEQCHNALLNPGRTNGWKYLNFAETTNEVWVDLGASYRLTQLQIWTANTARRDPVRFRVYAANGNSAALGTGVLIASGAENCENIRNNPCLLHQLTPTPALRYIVIQFPEVRLPGDFMEVSRILMHGIAVP